MNSMKRTSQVSPFIRWILLSTALIVPFVVLTWEYFSTGLATDTSGIIYVILGLFAYGIAHSFRNALWITRERAAFVRMEKIKEAHNDNSDLVSIFKKGVDALEAGSQINFDTLLTVYSAKQSAKIRSVSATSAILITAGLLGTVIGLVITISGISEILGAAGENYEEMLSGLNKTVQGMGTAFYTTFFGGLLGGIVLKALAAENEKAANRLTADALQCAELWLMPQSRALASKIAGGMQEEVFGLMRTLRELSDGISKTTLIIEDKQAALDKQFENMVHESKAEMSKTLNSGIEEMLDGFNSLVIAVESGHEPIKEKMEDLAVAINGAASATSNAVEETRNAQNKMLDGRAIELADKLSKAAELIEDFVSEDSKEE
ncbi:MAG: MotA/TolQ/ExbB proton channel family protein [Rhodospirillales bacterium]